MENSTYEVLVWEAILFNGPTQIWNKFTSSNSPMFRFLLLMLLLFWLHDHYILYTIHDKKKKSHSDIGKKRLHELTLCELLSWRWERILWKEGFYFLEMRMSIFMPPAESGWGKWKKGRHERTEKSRQQTQKAMEKEIVPANVCWLGTET